MVDAVDLASLSVRHAGHLHAQCVEGGQVGGHRGVQRSYFLWPSMELSENNIALGDAIAAVRVLVRDRAQLASVVLDFPPARNLPILRADKTKLKQILLNLLSNAIKFTQPGGRVSLAAAAGKEGIVLKVTDTGIGIAPESIGKAMEPFGQIDSVLSRRYEGSGLGLPLAKRLTELHGGELSLESEVGHGTTVKLFLPVFADQPKDTAHQETPAETPLGRGEKVLIVEDDDELRAPVVTLLEKLGYEPYSAEDAHAGMRHLESDAEVDLLLSDIVLPGGMDGIELGRKARSIRPAIRVLHFSGYTEEKVLRLAKNDPDFVLLPKPFERRVLAQRVREALDA